MSAVEPFAFGTFQVRVVIKDDAPWFVAADVCIALGYSRVADALRMLDEDDLGTHFVRTPEDGRERPAQVVTEAGVYTLVMRSQRPEAREFKRWVTHEVLPSIRKTGSYSVAELGRRELAQMVLDSERELEAERAKVAELEPSAAAWDHLASATGDLSVNEAAKTLSRDHKIVIGERRLWTLMADWRWTYRASGDLRPYQTVVDKGWLTTRPRGHHHPRTGEYVMDAPQVRITLRGVQEMRRRLTAVVVSA